MVEAKTNSLNWASIISAALLCVIAGLGVGIVIKDVLHGHGQAISALYGIVSGIFTAAAIVIFLFAWSLLKQK